LLSFPLPLLSANGHFPRHFIAIGATRDKRELLLRAIESTRFTAILASEQDDVVAIARMKLFQSQTALILIYIGWLEGLIGGERTRA